MKINRMGSLVALAIGAFALSMSANSGTNGNSAVPSTAAVARVSDAIAIERAANGRLLAIGRLDSISKSDFVVSVLGQKFVMLAGSTVSKFIKRAEAGQAVALIGEIANGQYFVDSAIVLPGSYVQGASKVYLRAQLTSVRRSVGTLSAGGLELDVSSSSNQSTALNSRVGTLATVIGSQPAVLGKVLVERFVRVKSIPQSDTDASVGTGSPDASVGTGSPNASVGTGSPNASVGTGSPNASVGTGSPNASVGTGSPNASVGTGSPNASVGTGSPNASVGTGSPNASVGTGSPDASVGTGSPDASVGTGSPNASVGTGSPDASVGTGSPDASVGTGSPDASVGTGSPDASVGTGSASG
jgi:hypothetical protein